MTMTATVSISGRRADDGSPQLSRIPPFGARREAHQTSATWSPRVSARTFEMPTLSASVRDARWLTGEPHILNYKGEVSL